MYDGHYQESLKIIQLLLEDKSIDLNVRNEDSLTPLEKALKLKHWEIARMIAKKMCPTPKITDSIYPLKYIFLVNHISFIICLLFQSPLGID